MEKALAAPPDDWDRMFWLVSQALPADTRFHASNFGSQPVWLVFQAFEYAFLKHQEQANITSLAVSKLAVMVCAALGGGKSKITAKDFLPYDPKIIAKGYGIVLAEGSGLRPEVARIIVELVKERKLPRLLLEYVGPRYEEIKALAKD